MQEKKKYEGEVRQEEVGGEEGKRPRKRRSSSEGKRGGRRQGMNERWKTGRKKKGDRKNLKPREIEEGREEEE